MANVLRFFGYSGHYSTTAALLETGLPSLDALLHKAIAGFTSRASLVRAASVYQCFC